MGTASTGRVHALLLLFDCVHTTLAEWVELASGVWVQLSQRMASWVCGLLCFGYAHAMPCGYSTVALDSSTRTVCDSRSFWMG